MKMNKENYYSTKDLSEASFLYASGRKFVNLKKENGRCWFLFEDTSSCQKLANTFWNKEAIINAKDFADSMRTLKDLIFNRENK